MLFEESHGFLSFWTISCIPILLCYYRLICGKNKQRDKSLVVVSHFCLPSKFTAYSHCHAVCLCASASVLHELSWSTHQVIFFFFFFFLSYPDPSSTHVLFSKSYSDPSCIFCLRVLMLQQLSPMTVSFALLCATAMWFMLIFPIILFHFLFFFTLGALYTDDFYFMGMHCSLDIWACANIALRGLFLLLLWEVLKLFK